MYDPGGGVPGGYFSVEGYVFNPNMFPDEASNVRISEFDASGRLTHYAQIFQWDQERLIYANEYTYTYDGADRLRTERYEGTYLRETESINFNVFRTTTYTYDSKGRLTSKRTVDDEDGTVHQVVAFAYDGAGRLRREAEDRYSESVGGLDKVHVTVYDYNAGGQLSEATVDDWRSLPRIHIYEYGPSGNLTKDTKYAGSQKYADEIPEQVTEFAYDAAANVVSESADWAAPSRPVDGDIDHLKTWSYGTKGELQEMVDVESPLFCAKRRRVIYLHEVRDEDGDGTPEVVLAYWHGLPRKSDCAPGTPDDQLTPSEREYRDKINNGNMNDGFGLNWEGHDTGTCTSCGNMVGEVNRILMGF